MPETYNYRGVTYRKIDGDSFKIEKQLVNGIKIPELELNVKYEGMIYNIDNSIEFLIDSLNRRLLLCLSGIPTEIACTTQVEA